MKSYRYKKNTSRCKLYHKKRIIPYFLLNFSILLRRNNLFFQRKVLTLPHTYKKNKIMQEYQLDFVTYCVGNLADRLNMSASKVYKMLRSTDILNGYMIPCYDVLHTFSKEYIIDDLINLLKKRGALK